MIYTVTFNPSVDYVVFVSDISYEDVNRVQDEYILAGGKGINVSRVLYNLGVDNIATGFVAGFTGRQIVSMLEKDEVSCSFIEVAEGMSRINVKIKSKQEGEINGLGPVIDKDDIVALYKVLEGLGEGDYLVLGGNVQTSVADTIYEELAHFAKARGAKCVVDATGKLLTNALKEEPFLIKPNKVELEGLMGKRLEGVDDIVEAAMTLKGKGAGNVLVSLDKDGAVLVTEDNQVLTASAPKGNVVNSVGAGDSMVAGFIAGYIRSGDYSEALKYGVCAGSASAFSKELATKEEVEGLSEMVTINMINNY